MSLVEQFEKAAEEVKELSSQPSDADLLELYSLFKQATVGDCNTARPGMLDFKGKAKWDAWDRIKGMNQDSAKEKYVQKVKQLVSSIGKK
ncbi:acyl-CoA binding protein 1 [Osmia lignaria lignaria]|uniref:acyl-CoA-binding protein-like n=1 Tax=Osmia bicornis bicornis TaxID=1437191 RepID=UPI0010F8B1EB|nr:acyl-CoA-binding protein-like [Osmia bicornis bicornis]XP_034190357.1 acyl-CoA-binding protein-like [Osmia lignaria]